MVWWREALLQQAAVAVDRWGGCLCGFLQRVACAAACLGEVSHRGWPVLNQLVLCRAAAAEEGEPMGVEIELTQEEMEAIGR